MRQLRRHQGLSLGALSRLYGVSASFLAAVGRGSDVTVGTLQRIASGLGVPVEELFVPAPLPDELHRLVDIAHRLPKRKVRLLAAPPPWGTPQ